MSDVWKCNCPICRLFVHPILRRITPSRLGGKKGKNVAELAKGRPVEVIKLSEIENKAQQNTEQTPTQQAPPPTPTPPATPQGGAPQAPAPAPPVSTAAPTQQTQQSQEGGGEEEKKEEKEEKKQTVEVTVPREVLERIEVLEGEVDKIKKYVKASVEGIKATLVDLRSAMAELSNPFNILRKYADIFLSEERGGGKEGEEKRGNGSMQGQVPPYPQVIPVIVPMQQPVSTSSNSLVGNNVVNNQAAAGQTPVPGGGGGATKDVSNNVIPSTGDESSKEGRVRITPDLYQKLAQWVNSMLERVSIEKFNDLIDNYVAVGVIDRDVGEVLKRIASTINDLKSAGLSIEEQARSLKELLDALGVTKEQIEVGVMKAVKKAKEAVEGGEGKEGSSERDAASELLELIGGGGGT